MKAQDIQLSGLLEQEEDFLRNASNPYAFNRPTCKNGVCQFYTPEEVEAEKEIEQRDLFKQRYGSSGDFNGETAPAQHLHHHYHYNVNPENSNLNEQPIKSLEDFQRVSKNYGFERPVYQGQGPVYQQPGPVYQASNQKQSINSLPGLAGNRIPQSGQSFYQKENPLGLGRPPTRPNIIRQDLYDPNGCVCVPYQYCSMDDVVDRSGVDVILPLDPRSNNPSEEDTAILADDKPEEKSEETTKAKREAKSIEDESEGVSLVKSSSFFYYFL